MSEQWYRNLDWTPEIAAEFERKLARSRRQKPQYLRIQGTILLERHPAIARELLERCVALGDPWTLAAAQQDVAFASLRLGDVDAALRSLEAAIEQQRLAPMAMTEAPFDYCLLVAMHEREELYARALRLLEELGSGPFALTEWKAQAARALLLSRTGRPAEARAAAELALAAEEVDEGWIPGFPEVGVVPSPSPLKARLTDIAGACEDGAGTAAT